jgi:DUF4097 and DUF4098 domain-containing protein YvlB
MHKQKTFLFISLALILSVWGCDMSVNRSVSIRDGEHSGGLASVNGSIRVGARCSVDGGCHTVNGRVEVGDGSQVRDLETVNGRISIGSNADVAGDVETVNGAIECGSGSKVHGKVSTVNGRIELDNTEVDEELAMVNGDILLRNKSVVRGDIVIKGHHGNFFDHHQRLEIRIESGSRVEGGIIVRDEDAEVKVYLSKDATVKGEIRNAQVIKE